MRAFVLLLGLAGCAGDETISGFLDPASSWRLIELNSEPFTTDATLRFPEQGRITGAGPCNNFTATQSAPYPWIEIGPIAATRRACPELDAEATFFAALGAMTLAEVSGPVLILSNDAGAEMVFEALAGE